MTGLSTRSTTISASGSGRFASAIRIVAAIVLVSAVVPARADTPARFEAAKTSKGLTFYHRQDASTPFAAINFGMRDIYALTTRGKEGFNAFGAALVTQSGDGSGQNEFMERMKDLTASASLSFGPFATQGSVKAPASTISAAMTQLASALKTAAPGERLLNRLRQRGVGAEAQSVLRAETIAERAAMRYALGDHPVTRGYDADRFDRLGAGDLADWRTNVFGRDRLRIAASGRISRSEAARIIDEAFAGLPTLPAIPALDWPALDIPGGTVVVEHDTQQSAVLMVGLTSIGPAREVETALIANSILGGGGSGRLWNAVRASLGSTYGANSGFQLVGPGQRLVTIRAAISNDQVKASVEALRTAYTTWRRDGVSAAELKATTTRMATEYRSALDDPARANSLVIGMLLAGRAVEEIYSYDTRVGGLDRAALNAFIAEKFPPTERLITVIVTPKANGLSATCVIQAAEQAERCSR